MPELFDPDSPQPIDPARRRGRGAGTNLGGRFERHTTVPVDDGWTPEDLPPIRTQVMVDHSRSILSRNTSPDLGFDRSINPYRGCEHGCVYCYARPSHAQLGLSPGLDFETRLVVKPRAAALLAQVLRKPGYDVAPIAIGTNTDPYQPIESTHGIMRQVLQVLWDHRHPVTITTKGAGLTADLDLLGPMGRAGLARVRISLTTLDNRLSRLIEPRAMAPGRRIAAIKALAQAGVPVGVNLAPIIPALTDHELERLMQAAAEAGAAHASYTLLRLPMEVAPLFRDWLAREFPDRAARVMARVRETHGGRDYDAQWFTRMQGQGVHAQLIARRFALARSRLGLARHATPLRCDLFRLPTRPGDQLTFNL